MKVFILTDVGKKVVKNRTGDTDTLRILDFLYENHTASEEDLAIAGEKWRIRSLRRHGLIRQVNE